LTEEARISRRQRWWTAPEYREHLTPGTLQLLQFEAEATAIRAYQPVLVPGVVQTPAHAEFVLNWWDRSLTETQRRVRLKVRSERRRQVIESDDGPEYFLILDESVPKREIGGSEVMAEQLEALLVFAQKPRVRIRIIPFQEGAMIGMLGAFMVINLSDDDPDDAVLYTEASGRDNIVHDTAEVQMHRRTFEALWHRSLDEDQSLQLIDLEARSLRMRVGRSRRR
ncbi:MAG TPA: DUF5753 domain-containing protein, partial [Actinoplanes sp.]|nr:DUF5753 domain-containing protein [Actinoplanes sp.]